MSLNWEENWHFVVGEMKIVIKRMYKIGDITKSFTFRGLVGQHQGEIYTRGKW